jgi:hypothetical protein
MILTLALAASVSTVPVDTRQSAPPMSLHAACGKGKDIDGDCTYRIADVLIPRPSSTANLPVVCWPRDNHPTSERDIWIPNLGRWLARHPETEGLGDYDAVFLAAATVYPCHKP